MAKRSRTSQESDDPAESALAPPRKRQASSSTRTRSRRSTRRNSARDSVIPATEEEDEEEEDEEEEEEEAPSPSRSRRASSSSSSRPSRSSRRSSRRISGTPATEDDEEGGGEAVPWSIAVESVERQKGNSRLGLLIKQHLITWTITPPEGRGSFVLTEDITELVRAATSASGSQKIKREALQKRRIDVYQVIERLGKNDGIEAVKAAIEETLVDTTFISGYDAPLRLPRLATREDTNARVLYFGEVKMEIHSSMFIPNLPNNTLDDVLEGVDPSLAIDWKNTIEELQDLHQKQAYLLILDTAIKLDEGYRRRLLAAPSSTKRMSDLKEKLHEFCYGGRTSSYTLRTSDRISGGKSKDGADCWLVRVGVTGSSLNNPQNRETVSAPFSLSDWIAQKNDPTEANEAEDGMGIDEFKRRLDALLPCDQAAPRRGSAPGVNEQPHRPLAAWRLRQALLNATKSNSERAPLPTADPSFEPIFEGLTNRAVQPHPTNSEQVVVIDGYTSEVILVTGKKKIQNEASREATKGSRNPISIDHVSQVRLEVDDKGKVVVGFHSLDNMVVTSPLLNSLKHRYPLPIFYSSLAIIASGQNLPYLSEDQSQFEIINRIVKIIDESYRIWPIACPHSERKLQAAEVIVGSDDYVREVCTMLGAVVPESTKAYPTGQEYRNAIARASAEVQNEVEEIMRKNNVAEDFQGYLKPETGLTTSRPSYYEFIPVDPVVIENIKKVGKRFMEDAADLKITLVLNEDKIPAIDMNGKDSAEDIARACLLVSKSTKLVGTPVTPHEVYGLLLAQNIVRASEARKDSEVEIDGLILTSGHLPSLPFISPVQNKGPLRLSPSRRNHLLDGYYAGFTNTDPSTMSLSDYDGTPSFWIDAWVLNSSLRGDDSEIRGQLEALVNSARSFMAARGAGMRWLLKNEWSAEEEERFGAFFEKLKTWEDLFEGNRKKSRRIKELNSRIACSSHFRK
ncbi:uncharacterized protein JCM6883_004770 [Sporobolomyces salmoneus]|uniref:uncharacterized protein n=1 Tax=Sporobolomyces salmoneus TaxID=183962 RepID=UPI00317874C7